MAAVELKSGPRFGGFKVKKWSKFKVKRWSKFYFHCFPIFIVFWGIFRNTNSATMCQNSVFCKIWGMSKMRFSKRKLHFLFFPFLCWKNRNRKKKKKENGKAKKPYKNRFFLRWSSKNVKKQKNGFLPKIAWHYLCQEGRKNAHFRAHYLFWPKCFFGPKQCKSGKTIKIVVSAEIAQNQKWHLFLGKGVFWHGWKSGFY